MENKTIIIAPWARNLRCGKQNAKNYPFWDNLGSLLMNHGFHVIQIGTSGEPDIASNEKRLDLSIGDLESLIKDSLVVICIDSYVQHLCWYIEKQAICIWGKSDPGIFGHSENINLLKDVKNLRPDPYGWWEDVECSDSVWVSPETVVDTVLKLSA